eukprot:bmy_09573T0
MCGAFGKPQGAVARVHTGQVMMSIRTKLQNKEHVTEALLRAKFKFPGRQKIHISKKGGFTKFNEDEFESMVAEKRPIPDGLSLFPLLYNNKEFCLQCHYKLYFQLQEKYQLLLNFPCNQAEVKKPSMIKQPAGVKSGDWARLAPSYLIHLFSHLFWVLKQEQKQRLKQRQLACRVKLHPYLRRMDTNQPWRREPQLDTRDRDKFTLNFEPILKTK